MRGGDRSRICPGAVEPRWWSTDWKKRRRDRSTPDGAQRARRRSPNGSYFLSPGAATYGQPSSVDGGVVPMKGACLTVPRHRYRNTRPGVRDAPTCGTDHSLRIGGSDLHIYHGTIRPPEITRELPRYCVGHGRSARSSRSEGIRIPGRGRGSVRGGRCGDCLPCSMGR